MLATFGRRATMSTPQKRELLAYNILRSYMESDKTFDIATCMYYTGIDPFTKQPVSVAKDMKSRKMQRALMQFFKPENYFEVRKALIEAGRSDLIGGCDGLIPAQPPKVALDERRKRANEQASGEYYHKVKNPSEKRGYRPGRSSQVRQVKPGRRKA
jgi:hypothetical protein